MSYPLLDYIDNLPPFSIDNIADREFRVMERVGGINHVGEMLLLKHRSDRIHDGNYDRFIFYIYQSDEMWHMSRSFLMNHPSLLIPRNNTFDLNDIATWGFIDANFNVYP